MPWRSGSSGCQRGSGLSNGQRSQVKRLDTHALECLCALVAEAHVTRAAQRMGIGQPAMSEMLARLRETFDDPLLVRTRQGMTPTARTQRRRKGYASPGSHS